MSGAQATLETTTPPEGDAAARSGPTYGQQPPFVWSLSPFPTQSHVGQPDVWQFPWIDISWA